MKKYDYLIVGSGLFGATFAREMTDAGYKCLVVDKRPHIGGNVYSEKRSGIDVHVYGAHIFHTSNDKIWNYVNRFATFNNYINKPKVRFGNSIYSFSYQLDDVTSAMGRHDSGRSRRKAQRGKGPMRQP